MPELCEGVANYGTGRYEVEVPKAPSQDAKGIEEWGMERGSSGGGTTTCYRGAEVNLACAPQLTQDTMSYTCVFVL